MGTIKALDIGQWVVGRGVSLSSTIHEHLNTTKLILIQRDRDDIPLIEITDIHD